MRKNKSTNLSSSSTNNFLNKDLPRSEVENSSSLLNKTGSTGSNSPKSLQGSKSSNNLSTPTANKKESAPEIKSSISSPSILGTNTLLSDPSNLSNSLQEFIKLDPKESREEHLAPVNTIKEMHTFDNVETANSTGSTGSNSPKSLQGSKNSNNLSTPTTNKEESASGMKSSISSPSILGTNTLLSDPLNSSLSNLSNSLQEFIKIDPKESREEHLAPVNTIKEMHTFDSVETANSDKDGAKIPVHSQSSEHQEALSTKGLELNAEATPNQNDSNDLITPLKVSINPQIASLDEIPTLALDDDLAADNLVIMKDTFNTQTAPINSTLLGLAHTVQESIKIELKETQEENLSSVNVIMYTEGKELQPNTEEDTSKLSLNHQNGLSAAVKVEKEINIQVPLVNLSSKETVAAILTNSTQNDTLLTNPISQNSSATNAGTNTTKPTQDIAANTTANISNIASKSSSHTVEDIKDKLNQFGGACGQRLIKSIERLEQGKKSHWNPYWANSSIKLNCILDALSKIDISKPADLEEIIKDRRSELYTALNMQRLAPITFLGRLGINHAKSLMCAEEMLSSVKSPASKP